MNENMSNNVQSALRKLGVAGFRGEISPPNPVKVEKFEQSLSVSLPTAYRVFLEQFGNVSLMFPDNIIVFKPLVTSPWDDKNGMQSVGIFMDLMMICSDYIVCCKI